MKKITLLLTAMALAVLLAALPAQAATTTTFVVDRPDDNAGAPACTDAAKDCSMRGAIIAANATEGADVILLATIAMIVLYLLAGCVGSSDPHQQQGGDWVRLMSGSSARRENV